MSDEDLNVRLKSAAEGMVGKKALTSKFGLDCFALVDKLLRNLGAQTAADGDVAVTATADYDWGDGLMLESIRPGDILQFRKHVVQIQTFTWANGKWYETESRTLTRPHHTAIVVEVHKDGSVTVIEQNVHPNPGRVNRNVIPRLEAGEETKGVNDEKKVKMTVTGAVRAYRPAQGAEGCRADAARAAGPGRRAANAGLRRRAFNGRGQARAGAAGYAGRGRLSRTPGQDA